MAGKVQKINSKAQKLMDSQVRAGKDIQMMLEGQKWLFGGAKIIFNEKTKILYRKQAQ